MSQQEVPFFWIGFCLFAVQAAERSLGHLLTVGLPEHGIISVESLEADTDEHRRKTLGQLVAKLSKRAEMHPEFVDRLNVFVENRNIFIHRFGGMFDLGTDEGIVEARAFCQALGNEAYQLTELLTAFLFGAYDRLSEATGGALTFDDRTLPEEEIRRMQEIGRLFPAFIRRTEA